MPINNLIWLWFKHILLKNSCIGACNTHCAGNDGAGKLWLPRAVGEGTSVERRRAETKIAHS